MRHNRHDNTNQRSSFPILIHYKIKKAEKRPAAGCTNSHAQADAAALPF